MDKDEKILYYIEDPDGNVCDSNLTYEEAIMWMESCGWNGYLMKIMG